MITHPSDFDTSAGATDNEAPMECSLALAADAANTESGGKLNVLGVFDVIRADKFPYVIPQFYVVVRFTAGPAEFGLKKQFELVILNPDGQPIGGRIQGKASVPHPTDGNRSNMVLILRMVNVPFEKAGGYAISILVGGEEKASIPLEVVSIQSQRARKKKGG